MKGNWESMETAPRDGRPVWCQTFVPKGSFDRSVAAWASYQDDEWRLAGDCDETDPYQWFNPEADA